MKINGVNLDFHLYDEDKADIREKYFEELNKMRTISQNVPEGTEAEKNKYLCARIKSLFDTVFGEGTGVKVCGKGNDRLLHISAYSKLVEEQMRQNTEYKKAMDILKDATNMPGVDA